MYQLTITFESGQQMADTIADLVNNHRDITISVHLDEMTSPAEFVPFAPETKPAFPVDDWKRKQAAKEALFQMSRQAIERYDCPTCGRTRFNNCHSASGNSLSNFAHKARRDLATYGEAF